jgi:hypothetical protein
MDKNVTAAYILDRFEPTDKIALVVIDRSKNDIKQRITTAERAVAPEYQAWLRHENAQHRDVYIGMNPLREDARGRQKEDIDRVKHVYLDFDEGAVAKVNAMMERDDMPIPHAIVNTSPGKYQIVWNADSFSQIQAEWLMRRMSREFGADIAATDSSRVLRLPGLNNWKREMPFMVTVQSRDGRPFTPGDFPAFPERELPARMAGVRRQLGSGISQSEKDFAFACGELEKGVKPDRVVAALELRRPDKPNPTYYANHTVESARRKVTVRDTISR